MSEGRMERDNVVMGQPVDRQHLQRAKELRRTMTPEEKSVWERVRRNGLGGLHLRRQQVIDGFIVDFYCHAARLVVEIDGGVHAGQRPYDEDRDTILAARSLEVLRITNEEIRRDLAGVLSRIATAALNRAKPHETAHPDVQHRAPAGAEY